MQTTCTLTFIIALMVFVPIARAQSPVEEAEALHDRAVRLAHEYIIVDSHVDLPYRLNHHDANVAERTDYGDFDYVRAKIGGLDAPFMSIYIPVEYQETGGAKALADSLIDRVEQIVENAPDKFALATSPEDVRSNFEQGLISLPMGIENGAALEGELSNVEYFYNRGVRYMTLAHATPNKLADSSYDSTRVHGGLSDLGEAVVREMNRLGMMVDVSHITDEAVRDVLRITEAPVIASHSSARHFTPGWERNLSDELIKAVAENGGVVMVVFGSSFLRDEYQDDSAPAHENVEQYLEAHDLEEDAPAARRYAYHQRKAHPVGTVGDVADHIDYIVELVGVEHVGLGSDFDGVYALPVGLQDVSGYPNLIEELLQRGYTEEEIQLILGENLLRVWNEVEQVAAELSAK